MLAARVSVVFPFAGPWKGNAKCNVVIWNRNWTPDAEKSEERNATSTSTVPGTCLGATHSSSVLETTVAATVVMLNRQRHGCRITDMKFCQSTEQTRYARIEIGCGSRVLTPFPRLLWKSHLVLGLGWVSIQ